MEMYGGMFSLNSNQNETAWTYYEYYGLKNRQQRYIHAWLELYMLKNILTVNYSNTDDNERKRARITDQI